jgi:hypothetical protein
MTGPPDRITAPQPINLPGIIPPVLSIYPICDHIADKLCATIELHEPLARPSSRVRDLVDLVVIARTQTIGAAALLLAIEAERLNRELPPIRAFHTPAAWVGAYPSEARGVAECSSHSTHAEAAALVARLLDPVLSGQLQRGQWDPAALRWDEE